ncbi:MAG TPA: hypothetical protein VM010_00370, partial [Chitinophagaceae bacterium]|nr:hypothetical protein [Chitinophagaceae bacterium]
MYYIVFGFLYALSLLPLRVLYLISDAVYGLIFYIIKYRRAIVMQNLTLAFPQKTEAEKEQLAKQFYKNFCDTFIETIKFISADARFFRKRFTGNYDAIENLYASGRPVQIHLGHNFNWELANLVVPDYISYNVLAVYLPLKNKIFDRLFRYIRTRNRSQLIASNNFKVDFAPFRNTQYLIGLVADQNPAHP